MSDFPTDDPIDGNATSDDPARYDAMSDRPGYMSPREQDELASAYLDGEATNYEVAFVADYPELQARVEELRTIKAQVATSVEPPAEAVRDHMIAQALGYQAPVLSIEDARRRRLLPATRRVLVAAALMIAMATAGVTIYRLGGGQGTDDDQYVTGGSTQATTSDFEVPAEDSASGVPESAPESSSTSADDAGTYGGGADDGGGEMLAAGPERADEATLEIAPEVEEAEAMAQDGGSFAADVPLQESPGEVASDDAAPADSPPQDPPTDEGSPDEPSPDDPTEPTETTDDSGDSDPDRPFEPTETTDDSGDSVLVFRTTDDLTTHAVSLAEEVTVTGRLPVFGTTGTLLSDTELLCPSPLEDETDPQETGDKTNIADRDDEPVEPPTDDQVSRPSSEVRLTLPSQGDEPALPLPGDGFELVDQFRAEVEETLVVVSIYLIEEHLLIVQTTSPPECRIVDLIVPTP